MITIGYLTGDPELQSYFRESGEETITFFSLEEDEHPAFAHVWIIDVAQPTDLSLPEEKPFFTLLLTGPEPPTGARKDTIILPRAAFKQTPSAFLSFVKQGLSVIREKRMLEKEIQVLKTVETLYLTQEQDKAFSHLIYAVADILETKATGMLFLRDPKKAAYDEYYPLEERRKGKRMRLTFHPEFLDEILFSSKPYTIVDNPNEKGQKLVGLPIRNDQEGMGIIFVPLTSEHPMEDRLRVAAQFTMELSSVLENLLLFMETKELTIKDDLTQAYNRRYFEAFVDEELERAKRYGSNFCIIFLDLDDLKQVNNRYGHLMGSRTLQEVSKRILKAVRHVDRVVRFGGDEFCIILPHTDPEEAKNVAERVRHSVNSSSFSLAPGVEVKITASFGVAGYPIHGKTKEVLIAKADQAMYKIKTKQKNGVQIADAAEEA